MRKRRHISAGWTIFTIVAIAALLLVPRYVVSAHQALPTDMPKDAKFVSAGTDIRKNRTHGEWVACHYDLNQKADLCRLTNQAGVVVFQGQFLPVGKDKPLLDDQLKISTYDPARHWVPGPDEGFPIPVLPLENGSILVPANDSHQLAARWKANPDQLAQLRQPSARHAQ